MPPIPDSPPLNDRPHFGVAYLDAAEGYQDSEENSDVVQRNLAGMGKGTFHKTDAGFENRKLRIRKRISRQQRALRTIKNKQRVKCPHANIYNSDDDECSWMDDLDPKPQNGQEVVLARGVAEAEIDAYDAHLANHVAPYTAAQGTAAVAAKTAGADAQGAARPFKEVARRIGDDKRHINGGVGQMEV